MADSSLQTADGNGETNLGKRGNDGGLLCGTIFLPDKPRIVPVSVDSKNRGGRAAPPRFRRVIHAALVCDVDWNWLRFNVMASARRFA